MRHLAGWLIICLIVGLLCCVSGCRRETQPQIVLRFWNGFTGPDGRTMLKLVKRFNSENPDVHVLMQRMDWNTYYNKLFVAGIGKRAPEIFVVHTNAIVRFAQANFVRSMDDYAAAHSGEIRDIDPNVWRAVEVNGKHYGLPLDVHAMGMYYNRRLFREAGFVDASGEAKPPRTREEFMDAVRRMTREKGAEGQKQWGFVFANYSNTAYAFMKQFGGKFFSPDNSRCLINSPENVAALQFCMDMVHKEKAAPSPENFDAWVGFRQGRTAMTFEGIYMLPDLQKQKDLDFAGAPIPQVGPQAATQTGSHNLCLRVDLDARTTSAAWRFLKYLSDNSLDWAEGGQIPVRRSLRESSRFKKMTVQYQFARQIPYVAYLPQVPFVFEYNTEFDLAIEKALRGSATPQGALDLAAANVNKIIARRLDDLRRAKGARQ